ncbi:sulfate ABC transporter substrate-binding protein [Oculatella sp. LEGE 06141]|uniref:sulfate ABC transporter substrate-binding protein n=1 Tax=Oculatella sp. LEGE 06141 TaxID=1828648 RepID=UPI00187E7DC7|nr:sulfate ABC transporter substrate-binding protein [Oculatella sp. LEGE 06141]MBE9178939.1 sulfate ABC transporter substrate-binding protein [Oculatella sp. LEGE 06141]
MLSFFKRSLGWKRWVALFILGLGLSAAATACTDNSTTSSATQAGNTSDPIEMTLVSYAVTQAAYEQIIPKFVEQWKQDHNGQEVIFDQSYGGSGSQTRAVIDGLEADVVALALALDTQKIEEAGLIESGWEEEAPNGSIVHSSVAALVTRDGNPKGIQGWEDLTKDDVSVITANPKTSGGARWNFMVLWGAITEKGGNETAAQDYVNKVYSNVPILPKDAREATDVFFKQGQGDVLINYENEVILARLNGQELPYVIPTDVNISIDNPITVVDTNVDKHGTREAAEAFVQFLFTPEAQEEFAKVGFRPSDEAVAQQYADQFPVIDDLFTVQDLGGWDTVQQKFFDDGAIFDKIQASK